MGSQVRIYSQDYGGGILFGRMSGTKGFQIPESPPRMDADSHKLLTFLSSVKAMRD